MSKGNDDIIAIQRLQVPGQGRKQMGAPESRKLSLPRLGSLLPSYLIAGDRRGPVGRGMAKALGWKEERSGINEEMGKSEIGSFSRMVMEAVKAPNPYLGI